MSVTLSEALGQVDLEPGRIDRCHVNGHRIEPRVLDPAPEPTSNLHDEVEIMLDAWVQLPLPDPVARVSARVGRLADPVVPDIPRDEDWP